MTESDLLRRCLRFETMIWREMSERVVPFEAGFALLDTRLPLAWDSSGLLVERPGLLDAEALAARADQLIGGAGMSHRLLVVGDAEEGERLRPGFEALGYETEVDVYMALRRDADRPAETAARETRFEEVEELRRAMLNEHPDIASAEEAEQVLAAERERGRYAGERYFVAPAEGEPVSVCCLLARGDVGQVEDVATLESARDQGLARATILAAVEASRAEKHELTFLGAIADRWPRQLYERLGFDAVGEAYLFFRRPESPG